ncbi:MAG TPA: hypothetical protein VII55_00550 [Candidatus Saccharimonadales bacterium]
MREPAPRSEDLYSDPLFRPVDVAMTVKLHERREQAVMSLLGDGFDFNEAVRSANQHIDAAASFASGAGSQEELQSQVKDTTQASEMGKPQPDHILPAEAVSIASFLPLVTPYEFNLEQWLVSTVEDEGLLSASQPALRWLEIWGQEVPRATMSQVLGRCVEADEALGGENVALYSGKLEQFLETEPDTFEQLMDAVGPEHSLTVFSQLGPRSPYVGDVPGRIKPVDPVRTGRVSHVRHTDYLIGDDDSVDLQHRATLFGENRDGPDVYGDAVLVAVKGILLGSINMSEQRSLLALQTVEDKQGKLPMVTGGIYAPRQWVVDMAEAAFAEQGKWASIDVGELVVRPIRFLGVETPADIGGLALTTAKIANACKALGARV